MPKDGSTPNTTAEWKSYFARRLRNGTLDGARVIVHLRKENPDLDPVMLAEVMEQAALEVGFMRGTERVRRLNMLARAERLFRRMMDAKDDRGALKVLEFVAKLDGLSGDLSPLAALLASEAWRSIAPELLSQYPDAYAFTLKTLVSEEARQRRHLAPPTITTALTAEPDAAE